MNTLLADETGFASMVLELPMFRKIRLTVLYFVALVMTALGLASLSSAIVWQGTIAVDHWGRVRVVAGNVQLVYALQTEGRFPAAGFTMLQGDFGVLSLRTGQNRQWRWAAVNAPVWVLVLVLFLPTGVAYVLGPVRRRRRRARGQCVRCGYALIGITSDRCPECGSSLDGADVNTSGVIV